VIGNIVFRFINPKNGKAPILSGKIHVDNYRGLTVRR
jgi:hypothetical protein